MGWLEAVVRLALSKRHRILEIRRRFRSRMTTIVYKV